MLAGVLAVVPASPAAALVNHAPGGTATQSSDVGSATADRAIDGNANGHSSGDSYSKTTSELEPWWQLDLGAVVDVGDILLWERWYCCDLLNAHVLISDIPFLDNTLAGAQATPGVTDVVISDPDEEVVNVVSAQRTARYIRVQHAGTTELAIGEVQVLPQVLVPDPLSTYVVDSAEDDADSTPGNGICDAAGVGCTLRAALTEANLDQGPSRVEFAIPGAGPHEIRIFDPLPGLSDPGGGTVIDGYTQPGSSANTLAVGTDAVHQIVITIAAGATEGFRVYSAGNELRGLVLHTLKTAVYIRGNQAVGNKITGTWFGTDAGGTIAEGNIREAVRIDNAATFTEIGGPTPAERVVMSGSDGRGIAIWNAGTDDTTIRNTYIGLMPDGVTTAGSGSHGLDVNWGPARVTVGGDGPLDGNVISANDRSGIEFSHANGNSGHVVAGNLIGTDAAATAASTVYGNQQVGINIEDRVNDVTIRDNTIVNHPRGAIQVIYDTYDNTIRDNRIGLLPDDTPAGNDRFAVLVNRGAVDVLIEGNEIANTRSSSSNRYSWSGGAIPNAPYPGGAIEIDLPEQTRRVTVRENISYDNDGQAVDLAPIGTAEPNDPGDVDTGPNTALNHPEITLATPSAVQGTTCPDCTVEVGVAEGVAGTSDGGVVEIVGTTVADGLGGFTVTGPALATANAVVAIATDLDGNSSELSAAVSVGNGPVPPEPEFTVTCDIERNCTFDASASFDPDGTIVSWDWDFGDGGTDSGEIVNHTYAAYQDYTVILTVTDDNLPTPLVNSEQQIVGVYAPLDDQFNNRNEFDGWGTASPSGGPWTPNWTKSDFSVIGGRGLIATPTGTSRRITQADILPVDQDITFRLQTDVAPVGGAGQTATVRTRLEGSDGYQLRMRLFDDSSVRLRFDDLTQVIGSETTIATTHTPGQDLQVRFQTVGTFPTTLRAKVWNFGAGEPATWDLVETDANPVLQDAGQLALGSSTNGSTPPTEFSFENVLVTPLFPPTPVANVACTGVTCTLDGTASTPGGAPIATYEWDTGDGGAESGMFTSHAYGGAGTYDVTLTVTDTDGLSSAVVVPATVTVGAGTQLLDDEFTRTESGGWGTAQPLGGDWAPASNDSEFSVDGARGEISTDPGTARRITQPLDVLDSNVALTIDADPADANWGRTATVISRRQSNGHGYEVRVRLAKNGNVYLRPRAAGAWLGAESQVSGLTHTPGTPIAVRVQTTGTNPTRLSARAWAQGAAEPTSWDINLTDSSPTVQASGQFAIQTYVSSGAGSAESIYVDDVEIVVPDTTPVAAFSVNCAGLVCDVDGTSSSDPDGTIVAWDWDFGDGATDTGATAQHTYALAGSYVITLDVTDDHGNHDITTVPVTVPNQAPIAVSNITCVDADCTLDGSGSSDPDGTIVEWTWDVGGGTILTGEITNHTFTGPDGTYPVTLTVDDDGGGSTTIADSAVVDRRIDPVAGIAIDCLGLRCTFDGSSSTDVDGTVVAWDWDFGDGATDSGVTVEHEYASEGPVTVTLVVTDDDTDTGQGTSPLTASAVVEDDDFARVVGAGWGTAPLGTSWVPVSGTTDFSVDGSAAQIVTAPGASREIGADPWRLDDVSVRFDVSLGGAVSADHYVRTYLRQQPDGSEVQIRMRVRADGSVRLRAKDPTGWLGSEVTVAGLTHTGQTLAVRAEIDGNGIRARAWDAALAEPGVWQLTATTAHPSLQGDGQVSIGTWLASSAASASTTTIDDLTIRHIPD